MRLSIANYETVVANALRRTLRTHDAVVVPRVSDLSAMVQSTQGKIEFDTMDDSDADQVIAALVSLAIRQCFAERALRRGRATSSRPSTPRRSSTPATTCPTRTTWPFSTPCPPWRRPVERIAGPGASDGEKASAVEFVLEGLYLTKRLAKDASGARALYRSRNR